MRLIVIKKWHIIYISSFTIFLLILLFLYHPQDNKINTYKTVMYYTDQEIAQQTPNDTEYFRPSPLPIVNDRVFKSDFFHPFYEKEVDEIIIPTDLLTSPYDMIINFFSILKHAANHVEGKGTGCGTLGRSRYPYPVAYNFLSSDYQEQLNYNGFLALFENMLHMNLIKLHEVPNNENCDGTRYFIEFETIEGSEGYKIDDLSFQAEDYLCAPYHGWNYIAEAVVDIMYGNWCSLVEERYEP